MQKRASLENQYLLLTIKERKSRSRFARSSKMSTSQTQEDQDQQSFSNNHKDSIITSYEQTAKRRSILFQTTQDPFQLNPLMNSSSLINPPNAFKKDELKQRLSKIFLSITPQEQQVQYMKSLKNIPDLSIPQSRHNQSREVNQTMKPPQIVHQSIMQTNNFVNLLENKKSTILNFGFRSSEKQNNIYIRPLVRLVQQKNNHQAAGTMFVADLWSDKNIKMVLEKQNICKDKFLINRKSNKNIKKPNQLLAKSIDLNITNQNKLVNQIYNTRNLRYLSKDEQSDVRSRDSRILRGSSRLDLQRMKTDTAQSLANIMFQIDEIHDSNLKLFTEVSETINRIRKQ